MNSPTTNCQPRRTAMTIPSSTTRFVDAISNAMAAVKFAPLRNSERASATAASGARGGRRSEPRRDHQRPRGIVGKEPPHLLLGHDRLNGCREAEAEDQRPEDLPEHPEAERERSYNLMACIEPNRHRFTLALFDPLFPASAYVGGPRPHGADENRATLPHAVLAAAAFAPRRARVSASSARARTPPARPVVAWSRIIEASLGLMNPFQVTRKSRTHSCRESHTPVSFSGRGIAI